MFKRVGAQIVNHDWNAKDRQFKLDDPIFVKNFSTTGPVWIVGIINEKKGPLTFHIELVDGRILLRCMEHIRQRMCEKGNKQPVDWDNDSLLTPTSTSATTPVDNNPTAPLQPAPSVRRSSCV